MVLTIRRFEPKIGFSYTKFQTEELVRRVARNVEILRTNKIGKT